MDLRSIQWTEEEKRKGFNRMAKLFLDMGQAAIQMNHYDFFNKWGKAEPQLTLTSWRDFLHDSRVSKYIEEEFSAIKDVELRKIINDISESKSVGQAQIINALQKPATEKTTKSGPIFIYTYVPATSEQQKANNYREVDHDIFAKGEEHVLY